MRAASGLPKNLHTSNLQESISERNNSGSRFVPLYSQSTDVSTDRPTSSEIGLSGSVYDKTEAKMFIERKHPVVYSESELFKDQDIDSSRALQIERRKEKNEELLLYKAQVTNFKDSILKSFEKTMLILSGGAMIGLYHLGVIKALAEANCLPNVVSGTSGGAVVGTFICCRTIQEIRRELNTTYMSTICNCFQGSWVKLLCNLITTGHMWDQQMWMEQMKPWSKGDTTFLEAYKHSGRILNISVCTAPRDGSTRVGKFILNYKSTPHVLIRSAVVASAAFPFLIAPVRILEKNKETGVIKEWRNKWNCAEFDFSDLPNSDISKDSNSSSILFPDKIICDLDPNVQDISHSSDWFTDSDIDGYKTDSTLLAADKTSSTQLTHLRDAEHIIERKYNSYKSIINSDRKKRGRSRRQKLSCKYARRLNEEIPKFVDGSIANDVPLSELQRYWGVTYSIVSQVNPHVTPFIYSPQGQAGLPVPHRWLKGKWRGGFLLSFIERSLFEFLRSVLKVMNRMEIYPALFNIPLFSSTFTQRAHGNITLLPPSRDYLWSISKILCCPNNDDIAWWISEGEKMVWRKIDIIKARMRVANEISYLTDILKNNEL